MRPVSVIEHPPLTLPHISGQLSNEHFCLSILFWIGFYTVLSILGFNQEDSYIIMFAYRSISSIVDTFFRSTRSRISCSTYGLTPAHLIVLPQLIDISTIVLTYIIKLNFPWFLLGTRTYCLLQHTENRNRQVGGAMSIRRGPILLPIKPVRVLSTHNYLYRVLN